MSTAPQPPLEEKLQEIRRREEEEKAKQLAQKLNLPYINLAQFPIETDVLFFLDETAARQAQAAVIDKKDSSLKIALANPQNSFSQELLQKLGQQNLIVSLFICSPSSLEKAFAFYRKIPETKGLEENKIFINPETLSLGAAPAELKKHIESLQKSRLDVSRFLEIILAGALKQEASDVHLEGVEDGALVRYRLDGLLHEITALLPQLYHSLLSRLKLLSGMALNVQDRSQDGRFTIMIGEMSIEVRTSVIPGSYGENAVMRLLNPNSINLKLADLGLRKDLLQSLIKEIKRPYGIIINTGPTGSGKTTTLYAFLKEITGPEIKTITLEDPIEYHLVGVAQTQVEPERGYTFAAGLRAILRQDPDVILVGEIRDRETAQIAIQAASTGHLVFSTLHTNDAAGAIPRLLDLEANPATLSAALNNIIAQRLIRRLCSACKQEYTASPAEKEKMQKALTGLPLTLQAKVSKAGSIKLYRSQGCPACNQTGYKGRIGVYELIKMSSDLEKLIGERPSHAQVLEIIKQKGFVSMYQDGLLKVLKGISSLEELESVIGEKDV